MVKNLAQLKRTLVKGAEFEIVAHARQGCVGQRISALYHAHITFSVCLQVLPVLPERTSCIFPCVGRYSKRMAEYMNRDIHIGCMCPSVMISGAGNFPVRKKEKQNQAWDKNHQFFNETQGILSKMESILHGKELIKSSDEDAIERLEEKLENLKDMQERMKAANKAVRLKDTEKGEAFRQRTAGASLPPYSQRS
mgnify:CR=1 FL=1